MHNFNGYKEVSYNAFQDIMHSYFVESKLREIEIAFKIGLKSAATVKNAFKKDSQIVSDEVMSHIMNIIGLDGFILWSNSKRKYFVSE
jgi:hypothetical protein